MDQPNVSNHAEPPSVAEPNPALLTQFLANNDASCPVCGYNLRHLLGDICPECGQYFKLQIGATNVRFGRFLFFLAPMIIMAGIAALMTVMSIIDSPPPARFWGLWVILLVGWLEVAAIVFFYRRRRFFLVRSAGEQVVFEGLSWCINILILIVSLKFGR